MFAGARKSIPRGPMFLQNLHELGDALRFPWFRGIAILAAGLTIGIAVLLRRYAQSWSFGKRAASLVVPGVLFGVVGPSALAAWTASHNRGSVAGFAAWHFGVVQTAAVAIGLAIIAGWPGLAAAKLGWK